MSQAVAMTAKSSLSNRSVDGTQTTTHIHSSERAAFAAYSRKFGLDPAGLLALLLVREMRVGRLGSLMKEDVPHPGPRRSKVTVHGRHSALRDGIVVMAAANGTSVSNACAVLIRAELTEGWLERVIATRFES